MTLRCGCYREGDATVFGEPHECGKEPDPPKPTKAQTAFGRFVPSWRFVVPETSEGDEPCARHNRQPCWSCLKDQPVVGTYDPDLQEARIHQVLSPDELIE